MASRTITIERATRETQIALTLDLDGRAEPDVSTGLPFFDHLLSSMSFHGRFSLSIKARGDLEAVLIRAKFLSAMNNHVFVT
ncbi:MAG TPA: hypothetical protein VFI08_13420, partial [Spirochaetia bacterium]|nr:hypothetical protein [Spirochaetia bacterium]